MVIEDLAREWEKAGIQEGDVVLLHSNIRRTLKQFIRQKKKVSAKLILESFLEALGSSGTLLLPLFNFDFARGEPFDLRSTKSQMGMLSEEGRLYPGSVRTGHPIYSFAVIGAKTGLFEDVNNFSGYGKDSPFGILHELNGKIAVLNLPDQNSMTFYHYVEEMHNVPYRYHKTFTGRYTDLNGKTEERTYGLFVRDIEKGVMTHVDPMGELLWEEGLYSGSRYDKGAGLRVVSARALYNSVSDVIETGRAKGLLYENEGGKDA